MGNFKKKKCIIILISLLIIVTFCTLFFLSHKTNLKYNDWWIIGKSIEEIEDRYGEFDTNYPTVKLVGYCISTENSNSTLQVDPKFYMIEYDENYIAVKVFIAGPVGG